MNRPAIVFQAANYGGLFSHFPLKGGEKLKNPFRKKIGLVTLWLDSKGHYQMRFTDPTTGKDVRRVIPAANAKEAESAVIQANSVLLAGIGYTTRRKPVRVQGMAIREAIETTLHLTNANAATMVRYRQGMERFLSFMAEEFPAVTEWEQLKPSHFMAWVRSMQRQEPTLAPDTIRLAMVPIKRTSAHWAIESPERFRDIAKAARVKIEQRTRAPIPALSPEQLQALLEWLNANAAAIWPVAILQSLAGLRMLEAVALRQCDIDTLAETVTITKTPLHTPKNRNSFRTIPVAPIVLEALRQFQATRRVRDCSTESPICTNARHGPWNLGTITTAWQRALNGYPASEKPGARKALSLPSGFTPHNLRATFVTLCRRAGCDSRALQGYVGHAAPDILGQHYEAMSTDYYRREVAKAVTDFWQYSGNHGNGDCVSRIE